VKRIALRWNAFWFAPAPPLTLGVCRAVFFATLLLWQLPRDFAPWGAYSRTFWMPIWLFETTGLQPLPPQAIEWLQTIWKASLALSAIGLFTRPAMVVAFALGTYLMGLPHNFGQTQHFDTLVVFACGALALSHAADACSIDALIAARRQAQPAWTRRTAAGEYTWPIRFVWVMMSLIFCAAGISKLRHSGIGWVASDNLAMLLLRQQYHLSDGEPLTTWGIWVANHPWLARAMAAASVSVETLFPLALFNRYARLLLVPAGLAFLVGIRVLMGPTFEQFMLCCVFWVPWDRVLYNAPLYAAVARRRAAHLRGGLSAARAGARLTAGD
jgi:hypothetical protein